MGTINVVQKMRESHLRGFVTGACIGGSIGLMVAALMLKIGYLLGITFAVIKGGL